VLGEQGYLNPEMITSPADVLIFPMTEDMGPAISFATDLRRVGVRAQIYTEAKKFKAKMTYADKLGVPFVAFLGEDEIKESQVSIKNMVTGVQEKLSMEEAPGKLLRELTQRGQGKPIKEKA